MEELELSFGLPQPVRPFSLFYYTVSVLTPPVATPTAVSHFPPPPSRKYFLEGPGLLPSGIEK